MQALLIDIEGWEIQMERLLKQIEAYKPCSEGAVPLPFSVPVKIEKI